MPLVLRGRNGGEVVLDTITPTPTTQSLYVDKDMQANTVNATSFSGNGAGLSVLTLPQVNTFTSPGTFSVPATTTRIKVTSIAGAPGAAGQPGAKVYVDESRIPSAIGYRLGSYGGQGGTGGVTSFGSFVTTSPTGTVTNPSFAAISNVAINIIANTITCCYGSSLVATSASPTTIQSGLASIVYIQGPFPPSIPITIGAGGGGGGGGAGASQYPLAAVCWCTCAGSTGVIPVSASANGSPGSLTTGGAGAPSNPVTWTPTNTGQSGVGGAGGGGAGASGYSIGTGGAAGTKGTTTFNPAILPGLRITGAAASAGPSGSSTALVAGGAGGSPDYASSLPYNIVAGGRGGGGGFSGIMIVEYN